MRTSGEERDGEQKEEMRQNGSSLFPLLLALIPPILVLFVTFDDTVPRSDQRHRFDLPAANSA